MASSVARTALTGSRSRSSAVAGIWTSVRGSLSSSVLQYRSCSDEGLDGRVPPSPDPSSAAVPLVNTPLCRKFPPGVRNTPTFGADRSVYDRSAHPPRKWEGFWEWFRIGVPIAILKPQPPCTRTGLSVANGPGGNCLRVFSSVAQESRHDSSRQGFVSGKELPGASTSSEGIAILKHRQQEGLVIDSHLFIDALKRCSNEKDLTAAREVHDCIIQRGMDKNPFVANTLLNTYVKCGSLQDAFAVFDGHEKKTVATWNMMIGAYAASGKIDDARLVFDRMGKRDSISWNRLIGAYAKHGRGGEAYLLFLRMKREGFKPNAITYISILNPSASAGALEWVKDVHGYARRARLDIDVRVGSALVHMYAKCGSTDDARLVFESMKKRDVITWSIMIGAYAASGCGAEAYQLFLRMQREGFVPNAVTYANILNASASSGAPEWVKDVLSHARTAGLESDLRVGTALVHMYAKSGSIDEARLVFDRMEKRDPVTFNIMMGGLAHHGRGHEALMLFQRMNADGVKPDGNLFAALLSACCHAGLLDDGRRLLSAMVQDYGIEPTVMHYNCMVDLLGRAGLLEDAKLLIGTMPVAPDGVTWKALLSACRTQGNVELGELAAEELLKLEPENAAAYVLLSNIYAAAGRWEKVSSVRALMQRRGVRKEPGRSWIEVDGKIHEFVVGDTSHPEAEAIYSELDKLTDKLKAEGYVPDTQLVLHNIDEEDRKLVLCSHSEKLAIAYGLMHTPFGEPIRVYKNLRVCADCHTATKFISKVTGREIVARDAIRFHHFKDGACSCCDYW